MTMQKHCDRSNAGVSSVEFALIAIPLIALLLITFQVLIISTARVTLDSALQSLAYDIVNAEEKDIQSLLNKDALCQKSALFLVACKTDPKLCFASLRFDAMALQPALVTKCKEGNVSQSDAGCCYQLVVEYAVPAAFDLGQYLWSEPKKISAPRKIRAIAFVYRI